MRTTSKPMSDSTRSELESTCLIELRRVGRIASAHLNLRQHCLGDLRFTSSLGTLSLIYVLPHGDGPVHHAPRALTVSKSTYSVIRGKFRTLRHHSGLYCWRPINIYQLSSSWCSGYMQPTRRSERMPAEYRSGAADLRFSGGLPGHLSESTTLLSSNQGWTKIILLSTSIIHRNFMRWSIRTNHFMDYWEVKLDHIPPAGDNQLSNGGRNWRVPVKCRGIAVHVLLTQFDLGCSGYGL
jgi:hypothetical protein